MKRILNSEFLLPLIIFAGMAQYALVATDVMVSGKSALWQLESEELNSSGPLRYVKDFVVVCLSVVWPIYFRRLPRALLARVQNYFLWFFSLVWFGCLPFLFNFSPISFLPAGLRWLLLLHAAFGVFISSSSLIRNKFRHLYIFKWLWLFLALDGVAVLLQFNTASNLFGQVFGASRLTGLFSNAGVAAFFAMSVALISMHLDGVTLKRRIFTSFACTFLALSSGTRFATTGIFIISLSQIWELAEVVNSRLKTQLKLLLVPLSLIALIFGYQALNQQVDRGDAISQQFEKGGRIGNLLETVDMLSSGDLDEVLIGRGLGIGTNTAIAANLAAGINPSSYRFNILVDNAFLTGIFQFGVLGSLVFWVGILRFFAFIKPKYSKVARLRFFVVLAVIFLTLAAGSPFEHYFLMMSFATSLGGVYWLERRAYLQANN